MVSIRHTRSFAIVFAAIPSFLSALLITFITVNSILYVLIGVLIGLFGLGNGILVVGAVFAAEHQRCVWWLTLAESIFMLTLGVYVAFSLFISPTEVALLAGLLASGTGSFVRAFAVTRRHNRRRTWLLGISSLVTIAAAAFFFLNQQIAIKVTFAYFSGSKAAYEASLLILASWLRGFAEPFGSVALRGTNHERIRSGLNDVHMV